LFSKLPKFYPGTLVGSNDISLTQFFEKWKVKCTS